MDIEILTDKDTNQSVMFCNTDRIAFGPVFGKDEDPQDFLDWLKTINFSSTNVEVEMIKTDSTEYRGMTDLEFVEGYIERLNHQIDKLPAEHSIRFLPCEHCGRLFMEINFDGTTPHWDHQTGDCEDLVRQGVRPSAWERSMACGIDETPLFEMTYSETGRVIEWETEDEDYARQCADEKWRSNHP